MDICRTCPASPRKMLIYFEHSHYPLKNILTDSQQNSSNVPFLETVFDFITVSSSIDRLSLDGGSLEQISLPQSCEVAKFDFLLRFVYDPQLNDGKLSCRFICSHDLFDKITVQRYLEDFNISSSNSSLRIPVLSRLMNSVYQLKNYLLSYQKKMKKRKEQYFTDYRISITKVCIFDSVSNGVTTR